MTARPWLISLAGHAALAAAFLTLFKVPETPAAVRMHFAPPGASRAARTTMTVPTSAAAAPSAPALPAWKSHASVPEERHPPPVPVSLDELLAGQTEPESRPAPTSSGWISDGYAPPPLPPPDLAPPQGAEWSLEISVPPGGGPGAAEGVNSGHPELDRWLEAYLRSVSFPPGLDGNAYTLRWNLKLLSDRPR